MAKNERVFAAVPDEADFYAIILHVHAACHDQHISRNRFQAPRLRTAGQVVFVHFIGGLAPAFSQDRIDEGLQRVRRSLRGQELGGQFAPRRVRMGTDKRIDPESGMSGDFRTGGAPAALFDHRGLMALMNKLFAMRAA